MHVVKMTTLKVRLDATEQFVVNRNYTDTQIHVTGFEAVFIEGELKQIKAEGFKVLKTGMPSKVPSSSRWFKFDDEPNFVAPVKLLLAVDRAKRGRSL